jgi:hypothetical protein
LLAILKIRGPLFCILNTFTAVIAAYFARRLAVYIKFMSQQAVAIDCWEATTLQRASKPKPARTQPFDSTRVIVAAGLAEGDQVQPLARLAADKTGALAAAEAF